MRSIKTWLLFAATLLGIVVGTVAAAQIVSTPTFSVEPYALRLKVVWVCAIIAGLVYAAMVVGLATARGRTPAVASRRRAELLWAVIPAVILIALASPAVETLAGLASGTPREIAAVPTGP